MEIQEMTTKELEKEYQTNMSVSETLAKKELRKLEVSAELLKRLNN